MLLRQHFTLTSVFIATVLFCAGQAHAQNNDALKSAAQKAINANPDVTARFNAYRAATDGVDAARGGYYPRLDLAASVGRDRDSITNRSPEDQTLTRSGASLTLTQLLWDGLATKNEVGRLSHERVARYFEVLDVTEQTALEATRAYYDVLRYRRLVQLAEENYVQHRSAFTQIDSRFRAGVGRGVDLEQAGARLALAESNLNTEVSNLHDVSARYQRVVGEPPQQNMPMPAQLKPGVPATALEASNEAVKRSPAISATVETLRSARSLASAREASYQPTLQARLRSGAGKNFDGVREQSRDSSAELVLNWNLFNGGTDRARVRQQANVVNQAADLRDKACRDTRQTVAIAYNDTRKLNDQLLYLDRNTIAIEKARDAYRQQFDIGQRSLLDLLNSENELYTARRSYTNADYDLAIAYARTHASLTQLGQQLGLSRASGAPQAPDENNNWSAENDVPSRCPNVVIESPAIDLTALDRRAGLNVNSVPGTTSSPNATVVTPRTSAITAPVASPTVDPIGVLPSSTPAGLSVKRLNEWAAAWESKNVQRYMSFYAPNYTPVRGTTAGWKAQRRDMLGRQGPVSVRIEDIQTKTLAADRVETTFKQSYKSVDYSDVTSKTLTWQRIEGQWFIVKESNR